MFKKCDDIKLYIFSRHRSRSRNREAEPTTPRRSLPKLQRQPSLSSKHSSANSDTSPDSETSPPVVALPPSGDISPRKSAIKPTVNVEKNVIIPKEEEVVVAKGKKELNDKSRDTNSKGGEAEKNSADVTKAKPLARKGSLRTKKKSAASKLESQDDIKLAQGKTYVVNAQQQKSATAKTKDSGDNSKKTVPASLPKKEEDLLDKLRQAG